MSLRQMLKYYQLHMLDYVKYDDRLRNFLGSYGMTNACEHRMPKKDVRLNALEQCCKLMTSLPLF